MLVELSTNLLVSCVGVVVVAAAVVAVHLAIHSFSRHAFGSNTKPSCRTLVWQIAKLLAQAPWVYSLGKLNC